MKIKLFSFCKNITIDQIGHLKKVLQLKIMLRKNKQNQSLDADRKLFNS